MLKSFFNLILLLSLLLPGAAPAAQVQTIFSGGGDVAVVFLHGLNGDPLRSFTHPNGTAWFDLIRAEAPIAGRPAADLSIYSVDYSDAFAGTMRIEEIATQIAKRRDFQNLFEEYNHVWFIAHSMGGLVLKRILVQMEQDGWGQRLDRVVGAAFLGVPAEGAALADFAEKAGGLGRLAVSWYGVDWSQVDDLQTVEKGNSFLLQLQNDWSALVERRHATAYPFRTPCAYETLPEKSLGRLDRFLGRSLNITVVPRLYASSTCTGRPVAIVEKHSMLPKPSGKNADSHDWMVGELQVTLEAADAAEVVRRPSWMSFQTLLKTMDKENEYEGKTIAKRSPRVELLSLNQRDYVAPDYPTLLERISVDHSCLVVEVGKNRRSVSLSLMSEISCALTPALACRAQDCVDP